MKPYAGKFLVVDLTNNTSKTWTPPESLYRDFLGGRGIGAKLLYDLMPGGVDPLSPDNLLMFLLGPLTGTLAPSTGKYVIVTKSPATGTALDTYSSGKIAVEMRYAGYDGLIIQGKAKSPSYLHINDDKVELRDASDLWGKKDAWEAEEILMDRYGPEFGMAVIGPAGENLVKIACVNSDIFRQAGRGGAGAVMGSKNLKAIAIRGTGSIEVGDIDGMLAAELGKFDKIFNSPIAKLRTKYGTPFTMNLTNKAGMCPTKNFQFGTCPEAVDSLDGPGVEKSTVAARGCFGCVTPCGKVVETKSGQYKGDVLEGPEYESACLLGTNCGIYDLAPVTRANMICDAVGVDTISAGNLVGFVMECYERGLITKEEANGRDMKFGNHEAALAFIEDIAHRRGLGDAAAEGIMGLVKKIGQGCETFAMQSKNLEFAAYDPRGAWGAALTYSVAPRGGCHRRAWPPAREIIGLYPPHTIEGKAAMVKHQFDENAILHSLLICDFPAKFIPLSIGETNEFLSAAFGRNISQNELWTLADRTETLLRMFNNREGFTRKDDSMPDRTLKEALPDGPAKGLVITPEGHQQMVSEYYELRGWDQEGVPKPETLKKYGLPGEAVRI